MRLDHRPWSLSLPTVPEGGKKERTLGTGVAELRTQLPTSFLARHHFNALLEKNETLAE